ncbi:hypothetical protein BY458DRAFT_554863 [Sporodiniella umbellata]|nr:hypothetical protein BY458DRAFT_554863 [Sporodiniella umbellata]
MSNNTSAAMSKSKKKRLKKKNKKTQEESPIVPDEGDTSDLLQTDGSHTLESEDPGSLTSLNKSILDTQGNKDNLSTAATAGSIASEPAPPVPQHAEEQPIEEIPQEVMPVPSTNLSSEIKPIPITPEEVAVPLQEEVLTAHKEDASLHPLSIPETIEEPEREPTPVPEKSPALPSPHIPEVTPVPEARSTAPPPTVVDEAPAAYAVSEPVKSLSPKDETSSDFIDIDSVMKQAKKNVEDDARQAAAKSLALNEAIQYGIESVVKSPVVVPVTIQSPQPAHVKSKEKVSLPSQTDTRSDNNAVPHSSNVSQPAKPLVEPSVSESVPVSSPDVVEPPAITTTTHTPTPQTNHQEGVHPTTQVPSEPGSQTIPSETQSSTAISDQKSQKPANRKSALTAAKKKFCIIL